MEARVKRLQPTQPPTPTAAAAAPVSSVLFDDYLLREILLRLEFPTSLIRAAAVCRWLGIASDLGFLRRFLRPPPAPPSRLLHRHQVLLLDRIFSSPIFYLHAILAPEVI
jgi:hypothetical protein